MANEKNVNASRNIIAIPDSRSLRQRGCKNIEKGTVTSAFAGNRKAVIGLLNEALAAELVRVLRDKPHSMATGTQADPVRVRAGKETQHVDLLAKLILKLGGEPNFSPAGLIAPHRPAPVKAHVLN